MADIIINKPDPLQEYNLSMDALLFEWFEQGYLKVLSNDLDELSKLKTIPEKISYLKIKLKKYYEAQVNIEGLLYRYKAESDRDLAKDSHDKTILKDLTFLIENIEEKLKSYEKFLEMEITGNNQPIAKVKKDLLLNQEQFVILFQSLQRINVFDSKQNLDSKMANAINLLTGYSAEKTRHIFSEIKDSFSPQKKKVIEVVRILLADLQKEN